MTNTLRYGLLTGMLAIAVLTSAWFTNKSPAQPDGGSAKVVPQAKSAAPKPIAQPAMEKLQVTERRIRQLAEEMSLAGSEIVLPDSLTGQARVIAQVFAGLHVKKHCVSKSRAERTVQLNRKLRELPTAFARLVRWDGVVHSVSVEPNGDWIMTVHFSPVVMSTDSYSVREQVSESWRLGFDGEPKLVEARPAGGSIVRG